MYVSIVQYNIERWSFGIDKSCGRCFLFVIGNLEWIGCNVISNMVPLKNEEM
jgi:hypothetical protein